MRITGERPVDGVTPDGLVALHVSGYRELSARIGAGRVLDIGCGVGFGSSELLADDREVHAVDYDLEAATAARARWQRRGLRVACMDGASLGYRSQSFDYVTSSHIIEHFEQPEHHVSEVARVLVPGGTALVLTPNAPADLENPFHVHLFEPASLRELLARHFAEVWVGGHDGSAAVKADFAERRRAAQKLLRLDVLDLRHRVPRRWYVAAYSLATRAFYRLQAANHAGGATNISPDDFSVTEAVDETTLNLIAVARNPLRR